LANFKNNILTWGKRSNFGALIQWQLAGRKFDNFSKVVKFGLTAGGKKRPITNHQSN
jgi:hypothetical protein